MSGFHPPTLQLERVQRFGIIIGLVGIAVSLVGIVFGEIDRFFFSYLFAYLFWFGISLGSLAGMMLHNLTGGNWGFVIRRSLESAAKTFWLMMVFFLPILAGIPFLYPWSNPDLVAQDPLLQAKSPYLNVPFYVLRLIVYFAIWFVLVYGLTTWSRNPGVFTDPFLRRRFQRVSAFGLILYFLTMSFASVDFLMSLQPVWISTIYGMLIIMEQLLSGLAFAVFILPTLLASDKELRNTVSAGHVRDLGAFLLTAVVMWAYLAFFQYLIIWSGNLPREVVWYIIRFGGGWLYVGLFIIILQFGLPFIVLLSPQSKRNPQVLAWLGLLIILGNLVDYFWQVIPVHSPTGISIHWLDVSLTVGIGGLWFATFSWMLQRTRQSVFPHALEHNRLEKTAEQETWRPTAGD